MAEIELWVFSEEATARYAEGLRRLGGRRVSDGATERMLPTLRSLSRTAAFTGVWSDPELRVIGNELLAAAVGGEEQ